LVPAALISIGLVLIGCRPDGVHTPASGKVLYASCVSCHGVQGEGRKDYGAPSIAGLPRWYVESQLKKFRTGLRGAHPDDVEGLRMRPMSRQMMSDFEVAEVSRFVAELKAARAPATIEGGNVEAGKAAYALCTACHGPQGLGNEAPKAPPIVGQHDWYLLSSLQKFKSGVRGTAPGDQWGSTMRPMAMTLADEQAMKNVVAYVGSLK
jgi:cytochrome c oxidase subunit 2